MKRQYYKWYSNPLGREMELLVFGHGGDPVLFFPTRTARFYDYEDWLVIDALKKKIDGGSVQVFCLDSVDRESFYAKDLHPAQRIIRHLHYEKYVLEEVIPLVKHLNPNATLTAAGCSLGAYHAANLAFKYPTLFHKMVGLSGRYDLTTSMEHFDDLFDGYVDENVYFNMPGRFVPNIDDPKLIAELKAMEIVFVVGERDVFLENNKAISNALWGKGVWNALHLWDGESHKARYWRHMVQLYL